MTVKELMTILKEFPEDEIINLLADDFDPTPNEFYEVVDVKYTYNRKSNKYDTLIIE